MSVDFNCYVGPHVRCQNQTRIVQQQIRACIEPTCARVGIDCSDDFCRACGHRICPSTAPQESRLHHDLRDALGDRLYNNAAMTNPGFLCWMPNADGYGKTFDDHEVDVQLEVTPDVIQESTARFLQDYADDILALTVAYGAEQCRVRYGVVTWYS